MSEDLIYQLTKMEVEKSQKVTELGQVKPSHFPGKITVKNALMFQGIAQRQVL